MVDRSGSVVIVGAGGHALVVADALSGVRLAGHVSPESSDDPDPTLGEWLGDDSAVRQLASDGYVFAVGIGFVDRDGARRRSELIVRLGIVELTTVQHARATVSPRAEVGAGTYVGAGAVIGPGAVVGRGAIINTGAIVEHDCRIGANVHIGPGAVLSGGVVIGDDTLIGAGATVVQGLRIGSHSVIGAAACVTNDQPSGVTAVGVPAAAISLSPSSARS